MNAGAVKIEIQNEQWILLPSKAMYRPKDKTLTIADLHIGKVHHFRKSGIADIQPERLIILGDLFHSEYNQSWVSFQEFLDRYQGLAVVLIKGNHDILEDKFYQTSSMQIVNHLLIEDNIAFIHDPYETILRKDVYLVGGHVHPGFLLKGKGKQSMRIPCFHFEEKRAIIPAFGSFTGLAMIEKKKGDKIYGVMNDRVIKIS